MNRTPNLTMLKPATEYAEKVARQIDVKAYMSKGNGMYMRLTVSCHNCKNIFITL